MGAKHVAVILAGGSGKRMQSTTPKQYLEIAGRPLISYAIDAIQKSFIDEIVLVVAAGGIDYCKKEIVEKYGFTKVVNIVEGGAERYDSVWKGLQAISCPDIKSDTGLYVYIHDGARPFISVEMLERLKACVTDTKACVAGVPVKDTIKVTDENGTVTNTPDRKMLWAVQTPQCFEYSIIMDAFTKMYEADASLRKIITDDAMVVEYFTSHMVKMVMGDYNNIKITTPEDYELAESILRK